MDLTVAAVPFYFSTMAAERRHLARRAAGGRPDAATYQRPDTIASLTMGTASLLAPIAAAKLREQLTPGTGRYPRALQRTAVSAALITTAADWLANRGETARGGSDRPSTRPTRRARRRLVRLARKVASVSGPLAVAAGGLALTTKLAELTTAKRMWERNGGRDLGRGLAGWLLAIAGWDLIYYWNHRLMHEVRALWAIHVVHHSSERYNLSTALRQPVADVLGVFVPYGLLSFLGVQPHLVTQARGVNLIYQYWIHTDTIRRLGPAEELFNTPSHHRVHHGSNRRYLDRNHGSILILWDRLFGTFQREDEPAVYGLTKNIGTFNPLRIASHCHVAMLRDVAGATNWRDRVSFLLRPPGWSPEGRGGLDRRLPSPGDQLASRP